MRLSWMLLVLEVGYMSGQHWDIVYRDWPEWDCFSEISTAFRESLDYFWSDDAGSSICDCWKLDFDRKEFVGESSNTFDEFCLSVYSQRKHEVTDSWQYSGSQPMRPILSPVWLTGWGNTEWVLKIERCSSMACRSVWVDMTQARISGVPEGSIM